mgnify:CR=1 FL=1
MKTISIPACEGSFYEDPLHTNIIHFWIGSVVYIYSLDFEYGAYGWHLKENRRIQNAHAFKHINYAFSQKDLANMNKELRTFLQKTSR